MLACTPLCNLVVSFIPMGVHASYLIDPNVTNSFFVDATHVDVTKVDVMDIILEAPLLGCDLLTSPSRIFVDLQPPQISWNVTIDELEESATVNFAFNEDVSFFKRYHESNCKNNLLRSHCAGAG